MTCRSCSRRPRRCWEAACSARHPPPPPVAGVPAVGMLRRRPYLIVSLFHLFHLSPRFLVSAPPLLPGPARAEKGLIGIHHCRVDRRLRWNLLGDILFEVERRLFGKKKVHNFVQPTITNAAASPRSNRAAIRHLGRRCCRGWHRG